MIYSLCLYGIESGSPPYPDSCKSIQAIFVYTKTSKYKQIINYATFCDKNFLVPVLIA